MNRIWVVDKDFDRGYCCAVANIIRMHGDTVIARDVLRANEPENWNNIDVSDRDILLNLRPYVPEKARKA